MKITAALLTIAATLGVVAAQSKPDIDVTILNYALTLEYLEANFYNGVLAKFSQRDFARQGYPRWVYQRVQKLAQDENEHVAFLQAGLGDAATQPCQYKFPYKTVGQALALSRVLESVGVSAYLGAAEDITLPAYLTAAGSILTVEARHQSVIAEINGGLGFPSPFDTPLKYSQVYSLAAPFITSCPSTNPALPAVQFPALTVGAPRGRGWKSQLTFECSTGSTPLYAHFLNGLSDMVVPIPANHKVSFPSGLNGVVYVIISTSKAPGSLTDSNTIAGPGYYQIPDNVDPSFTPSKKWGRGKHY